MNTSDTAMPEPDTRYSSDMRPDHEGAPTTGTAKAPVFARTVDPSGAYAMHDKTFSPWAITSTRPTEPPMNWNVARIAPVVGALVPMSISQRITEPPAPEPVPGV